MTLDWMATNCLSVKGRARGRLPQIMLNSSRIDYIRLEKDTLDKDRQEDIRMDE